VADTPELCAAYFTLAGDVYPFGPTLVSPFSFEERVEAAARAGWKGFGLVPEDIQATSARIGLKEMRNILDANGISFVELEFLVDWYRTDDRRAASDKVREEIFGLAEALGARDVKIGPGLGRDIAHPTPEELTPPLDEMIEAFVQVCKDAAERGTSIALEIMPFGNINTIADARRLVETADQPNGGLLLDIWHLSRGNQDFGLIRDIPSRFIKSVELDDAPAVMEEATLWDDTIYKRRLPGKGDLDVAGFIAAVQATGFDLAWSVEILSDTYRKLPLDEMARSSFDASMAYFRN
jgi:sugar phosphate isomerase/epimerase